MMDFWKKHVLQNQPGCLYISGMPGTGKTAMLTEIMRLVQDDVLALKSHTVKTVVVNCMSVKEPKQIYTKLVEELRPSLKTPIQSDVVKQAQELMNAKKNVLNVVILDEIDSLITKDQDVLYKIFEWASLPNSRLVLIGIANALDLTDRILPRLRAKNCEPQLLNFNPYQVSEISSIIKDRLFSLVQDPDNPSGGPVPEGTAPPLIMPMAIEFCARKVASSMGDLRTALDVCRQAIELAEMDYKKKLNVLKEQKSNTTADTASLPAPVVTVAHVSRVLNIVFGNSNLQRLKDLNLQQKIVLGVLLVMIRSSTTKANKKDVLTVGKVSKKKNKEKTTLFRSSN
ncbi:P-loop containing nucleoside triphosphate hydrolase protein [Pilaira anomala]|nr:P-loop containing nucleoside triphosphate hydrolase protein [Pilaira anomala]